MQFSLLIYIVVIFAVMYFLTIRPRQKRAKQHRELTNNIQFSQRVTAIGGIKGTVKAIDETIVVTTVNGHGTELTFEKSIIRQVDPS